MDRILWECNWWWIHVCHSRISITFVFGIENNKKKGYFSCFAYLLCLLFVTACLFPLFFCLKLQTPASFTWDRFDDKNCIIILCIQLIDWLRSVFIPLWVVFGFIIILPFALPRWDMRIVSLLRLLSVLAFFIVFRFELVGGALASNSIQQWILFCPLLIHEFFAILWVCVTSPISYRSYVAEMEAQRADSPLEAHGPRQTTFGLGYFGWLLRRFFSIAVRIALWCILAESPVKQYGLIPILLWVLYVMLEGSLDSRLNDKYVLDPGNIKRTVYFKFYFFYILYSWAWRLLQNIYD